MTWRGNHFVNRAFREYNWSLSEQLMKGCLLACNQQAVLRFKLISSNKPHKIILQWLFWKFIAFQKIVLERNLCWSSAVLREHLRWPWKMIIVLIWHLDSPTEVHLTVGEKLLASYQQAVCKYKLFYFHENELPYSV